MLKIKRDKGVTLVALIITIIVLLILAGITFSTLLSNNGILKKAQEAAERWKNAEKDEIATLDNIKNSLYDSEHGDNEINIEEELVEKPVKWGVNPDITAIETDEEIKVPIPSGEGFKQDKSAGNSISDGIVIKDDAGNEFVWVPCVTDTATVTHPKYKRWSTSFSIDSLPSSVNSWGQTEESQITKYGGFYIARYGAGIPNNLLNAINNANGTSRNIIAKPVSAKNSVPWNFISYSNAKTNAESMYSNDYMQSGLITGAQYDTAMDWLDMAGYNVKSKFITWGNYKNVEVTGITSYSTDQGATWNDKAIKQSGESYLLKTGNTEYTKANNIYDLAGNVWTWITETSGSNCVIRGGNYDMSEADTAELIRVMRPSGPGSTTDFGISYRCVLYLK